MWWVFIAAVLHAPCPWISPPCLLLHLLVLAPASSSSEAEQTDSSAWNRAGPSSCCTLALRFATGSCDHYKYNKKPRGLELTKRLCWL